MRGFSGLRLQGGKLLYLRKCKLAARSQIRVCGLLLRCRLGDSAQVLRDFQAVEEVDRL